MNTLYVWFNMLVGLIVIINPLMAVTVYPSLTQGEDALQRRETARMAAITVGVVMSSAALAGQTLLSLFGIGIPQFQVGGGILILLMAIAMLNAKVGAARHTSEEASEAQEKEQVGVVPLGIPLLAGPGAISTAIIYAQRGSHWTHLPVLLIEIWLVAGLVWFSLSAADRLQHHLGRTGLNIATRIMGLLLAAIAVGFITQGLKTLLPGLG